MIASCKVHTFWDSWQYNRSQETQNVITHTTEQPSFLPVPLELLKDDAGADGQREECDPKRRAEGCEQDHLQREHLDIPWPQQRVDSTVMPVPGT